MTKSASQATTPKIGLVVEENVFAIILHACRMEGQEKCALRILENPVKICTAGLNSTVRKFLLEPNLLSANIFSTHIEQEMTPRLSPTILK